MSPLLWTNNTQQNSDQNSPYFFEPWAPEKHSTTLPGLLSQQYWKPIVVHTLLRVAQRDSIFISRGGHAQKVKVSLIYPVPTRQLPSLPFMKKLLKNCLVFTAPKCNMHPSFLQANSRVSNCISYLNNCGKNSHVDQWQHFSNKSSTLHYWRCLWLACNSIISMHVTTSMQFDNAVISQNC